MQDSGPRVEQAAGGMHPQSRDDPVLGLHSCSALSPGSRGQRSTPGGLGKEARAVENRWSSVIR
jgi:hypothetical protein